MSTTYIKQATPVKAYQVSDNDFEGEETRQTPQWLLKGVMKGKIELIHPENNNCFRVRNKENASWTSGQIGDWLVYYSVTEDIEVVSKEVFSKEYTALPEERKG